MQGLGTVRYRYGPKSVLVRPGTYQYCTGTYV